MGEDQKTGLTRRQFIKAAGVTAAGAVAGSLISNRVTAAVGAPAASTAIGANDRLNVAVVGVGGMGNGHLHTVLRHVDSDNVAVAAVCDVWDKRRREAKERSGVTDAQVYSDYRKLLENKDIDAVVIATPDHWHGKIAVDAMEAGKHIYVEKPMTRYMDEAFKMLETAKRTKKIVQVGSQGCTDAKWHKAGEIVSEGRIGKVLWAQGSYCRNNPNGEWNYGIDPDLKADSIDWDAWLGSAPKIDFNPERYFRWRKYWDYGTGIIGDLWPHRMHPLLIATSMIEYPKRVACLGGDLCHTDEGIAPPRDVADTTMMVAELESGSMIYLAGSTVNEQGIPDVIRGSKATLYFGGGKVQVRPERPFSDEIEPSDEPVVGPGESHDEHHKNFWNAIRNNTQPSCDIELGTRVQTMVSLAERSYRESKMMNFDPEKCTII